MSSESGMISGIGFRTYAEFFGAIFLVRLGVRIQLRLA